MSRLERFGAWYIRTSQDNKLAKYVIAFLLVYTFAIAGTVAYYGHTHKCDETRWEKVDDHAWVQRKTPVACP